MNPLSVSTSTRKASVIGLAVVGFIALVACGIWLALYSTRYVPTVVNRAGAAAVYLGSVFNSSSASLSVVPTPIFSSTIASSILASSTLSRSIESVAPQSPPPVLTSPAPPTAGKKIANTYPIQGTSSAPVLSGLPDLVVTIKGVGYLATSSADSFVATSTVPAGSRPAVSFSIKNVGTHASGSWRFSATIPTQTSYIYQSQVQQSLNPGDRIDYVLGFDQSNRGTGQTISITANFDHAVTEVTADNNSTSTQITILGG